MEVASRNINRLYYHLLTYREDTYNGYIANELLQEIEASTPAVDGKDCILKLSICTTSPVFPVYIVDWYYQLRAVGVRSTDRPQFTIPVCTSCILLYLGMLTPYTKLIVDTIHISIRNARKVRQADMDRITGATDHLRMEAFKVIDKLTANVYSKEILIGESNTDCITHIDITKLRELGKITIILNP